MGPTPKPDPNNILFNPSFEQAAGGVGGGLPDGFWSTVQNDSAAAAFSDPRDSVHGLHSLRIHTPSDGNGQVFSHFMCPATDMTPETQYELSVWARGKSFQSAPSVGDAAAGPTLLLGLQGSNMGAMVLTDTWKRYNVTVMTPAVAKGKEVSCWTNQDDKVAWILNTTGMAFLDLIQLVPMGEAVDESQLSMDVDDPVSGVAFANDVGDIESTESSTRVPMTKLEYKDAPVQDSLGLPLSPIGFFTHELGFVNQTIPISTQRAGMTSGFIYLPHGDTDIDVVNAWLDRCDAVGTSVLLDIRFDATIFGARSGPKPSPAVVEKALAATKAKVAALMHHQARYKT